MVMSFMNRKLSKSVARHVINIVNLAEHSSDGYWCHEVMVYNDSVPPEDRDLVNALSIQVLNGKLSKSEIEKYL